MWHVGRGYLFGKGRSYMVPIVPVMLWLVIPTLLLTLVLHDRWTERRDKAIEARCLALADQFKKAAHQGEWLTRIYLQSYKGEGYPYNLFMLEYRTSAYRIVTIWLPVDQFLNAGDEKVRQVLSSELVQPGPYTIPDWTVALYDYIMRYRHEARRIKLPIMRRLARFLSHTITLHE
jgi:hypothetical protein